MSEMSTILPLSIELFQEYITKPISHLQRKPPCDNQPNCWLSHELSVGIMEMKSGLS